MRDRNLERAAVWGGNAALYGPLALLGYQILEWLQRGSWTEMPLQWLFEAQCADAEWISWLGVRRIVQWGCSSIWLGWAVFAAGAAVAFTATAWLTEASTAPHPARRKSRA